MDGLWCSLGEGSRNDAFRLSEIIRIDQGSTESHLPGFWPRPPLGDSKTGYSWQELGARRFIVEADKMYLANVKPFASSHFDYSQQYEMNYLSVSSLSWPSFLKINAGEPDSSKGFEDGAQGRG